ncbi:MAG: prepilin-type N-terminal cleavage/methylation domain-containing protein [Candidatus Omnitrophica bacterium]|nr:prepilin-type N-terminal cleavage/methylation domain-containing protein [Candidatus Omnitrophota bacterium]
MPPGGLRRRRGFTLIELLVVSGILIVIGGAFFIFGNRLVDLWETSTYQSDLRARTQLTLDRIGRELRHATRGAAGSPPNVSIAADKTAVTFYLPTDQDLNGLIIDAAGQIEWDAMNPIQYQYVPASQQLTRVVGGTSQVVAGDVSDAVFQDATSDASLLPDEVKVRLTLQKSTPHQRTIVTGSTAIIQLRN